VTGHEYAPAGYKGKSQPDKLGSGPINFIHSAQGNLIAEQKEYRRQYHYFQDITTAMSCSSGLPDERTSEPFASRAPEGQAIKLPAPKGFERKHTPESYKYSKRDQPVLALYFFHSNTSFQTEWMKLMGPDSSQYSSRGCQYFVPVQGFSRNIPSRPKNPAQELIN